MTLQSSRRVSPRRAAWIALLLLATALRLPFPDWDAGIAAHPDERFLLGVAQATPLWGDPCAVSPDFPYGHLPVYAARLLSGGDPLFAARLLAGLLAVLLVALAGALGAALGGRECAWFAAALLTVAPFPIQQARFYTVDGWGAVLASLAILAALRRRWGAAGAGVGAALACKASLAWVGVAVLLALALAWRELSPDERRRAGQRLVIAGCAALLLTSPWLVLRPLTGWRGALIQAQMAAGRFDFPYTRQYAGTWPFIYPLTQMGLWGLGPAATLAGLAGLGYAAWRWRWLSFAQRVAGLWVALYFLATAGLYVKFPRYLLPLYPVWVGWAVMWLGRRGRWALLLLTLPLGWAQVSLYAQPHPWIAASHWLYANVLPTETIAIEAWDHALPVPLPDVDATISAAVILPIFDADGPDKQAQLVRAQLAQAAHEAAVIVLASRRGYGALARSPGRYAETLAWYAALLRTREVRAFGRCPRLGPLALSDDPLADAGLPMPLSLAQRCGAPFALRLPRLDESFRVYDAPEVLLLLR